MSISEPDLNFISNKGLKKKWPPSHRKHISLQMLLLISMSLIFMMKCAHGQLQSSVFSPRCIKQNLALTVGGARDDIARCIVYDEVNQLIIVGGTTRSNDFGPANVNYGFLYAISLEGDWTWGHYFRSNQEQIDEITACKLSSDGKQIVALGTTRDQVVMAIVNGTDGRISNLYSLKNTQTKRNDPAPAYKTYGAVMLDSEDPRDGKAYIYASFLMDDEQQLVKILQAVPDRTNEFPEIEFHYSMFDISEESNPDNFVRQKLPQNIFQVKDDDDIDSFFMSGTYRGVGSVMRFYKKNAALRWHAQLDSMTAVDAIAIREVDGKGHIYGCGQNNFDDRGVDRNLSAREREAWFFSMNTDGDVLWQFSLRGYRIGSKDQSDSCQGMVFNPIRETLVTVIETNSPQFSVRTENNQRDTMLLELSTNGGPSKVISFSLGNKQQHSMYGFSQNLVQVNDLYYIAGSLNGFQTRTQISKYSDEDQNLDSFLFPLAFDDDRPTGECFQDREFDYKGLYPFSSFYDRGGSKDIYQLRRNNNRDVPKSDKNGVFEINYQKRPSSLPLRSFVNTPRPCAFQSVQLSDNPVEYYRGSQAITYRIANESPYGSLIDQMAPERGGKTLVIDQKGQETDLARFFPEQGGIVYFQSNVVRQIGLNELTIRHCDIYERLFDFRLQIEVKVNSQPRFVDIPDTNFGLKVNETLIYRLPDTIDPEGNSESQILIQPYEGYENLFPRFMYVFNNNRTFEFRPDKDEYAGEIYFYKIILKEVGLNVIGKNYYCKVEIDPLPKDYKPDNSSSNDSDNQTEQQDGDKQDQTDQSGEEIDQDKGDGDQVTPDPDDDDSKNNGEKEDDKDQSDEIAGKPRPGVVKKTEDQLLEKDEFIVMEMYTTDLVGRTQMKFTQPVNMTVVESDFDQLFTSYVQRADYRYNPQNITFKQFKYTNFNAQNQSIDLQFEFTDPFELGLNDGKSDHLVFFFNENYNFTEKILGQQTTIPDDKRLQVFAKARIELTFDFENTQMQNVVVFAKVFLIIMLIMVALQLLLLLYKGVGLLTFWILIDYAQLVAYLPLQTARCVPFVYEAFKPFLASHLIFTWPGDETMKDQVHDDYFNLSYQAYNITYDTLVYKSALFWAMLLILIIAVDILVKIIQKFCNLVDEDATLSKLTTRLQGQFRYNIYIRFMMMAYLDLVFVSGLVLFDEQENVLSLRSIVALLVLSFTVFLPWILLFYLCAKFGDLQKKDSKSSFNTLLLKVDKEDRWRIFLPCFYFFRRFVTSIILVLAARGTAPAYFQFAVSIMLSAILLFYLAKEEPYVTRRMNIYVVSMELLYFLVGMSIFAFTDATGEVELKQFFAIEIIVLLTLFVASNFIVSWFFSRVGKATLRSSDQEHKEWRRQEVKRRVDEKDRRKRKQKAKKQKEKNILQKKRLDQLEVKRDDLRELGYTDKEIEDKLPHEPIQKTGFQFGTVMGKRLIDYGILSSSSDDEDYDQDVDTKQIQDKPSRNTMTRVPTSEEQDYQSQDQDKSQNNSVQKLIPRQSMRKTAIFGRSAHENEQSQSNQSLKKPVMTLELTKLESQKSSEQYEFNEDEYQNTDRRLITEDDQLNTDRPMVTEADCDDEELLNAPSNRLQQQRRGTQNTDGASRGNFAQDEYARSDIWNTRNNLTISQNSQQNLNGGDNVDARIIRMANQQQ